MLSQWQFESGAQSQIVPEDSLGAISKEIEGFMSSDVGRYIRDILVVETDHQMSRLLEISSVAYTPEVQCELAQIKGRIEVLRLMNNGYLGLV